MYSIKDKTSKAITNIYAVKDSIAKTITNVYAVIAGKAVLVWTATKEAVSGVFGSGIWNSAELWNNDDFWKNEP